MPLSVRIDTSFIVPLLKYLSKPNDELLLEITKHDAARLTHAHAVRFGNTKKNIMQFWKEILQSQSKNENLTEYIKESLTYIYNNQDAFNEQFKDLWQYFPEGTSLRTNLYTILGYDIGIVSEGNALINLGHQDFHKNPDEILFIALHELHHVVYTAFNQIFDISQIHTTKELVDMIKYCTHMEGLAVYFTLEIRRSTNGLNSRDYQLFLNESARTKRVSTFFDILTELEVRASRSLHDKDWEILDRMAGKDRLWYVTGAHMAELIEKNLGRKALIDTIRLGPDDFFKTYHEAF
ncbi:MAG: hypothetical protein JW779_15095 [Candidatus Thorarchaeota archaeon]|nr:hypothetical protein [Candidatus Thorarchaeota archaeon]